MGEPGTQRRLSGILSADVVGYSRLMADDEAATVAAIETLRSRVREIVNAHQGRIVDAVGDNLLAEFSSIVDAVNCAIAIQQAIEQSTDSADPNREMKLRIGVNLGDVIVDSERIYGDGVNVAARLEGLADPGGIAISGAAFDQVRNKIEAGFLFRGDHRVKNIDAPIPVYAVDLAPEHAGRVARAFDAYPYGWMAGGLAALLLVLGVVIGGPWFIDRNDEVPAVRPADAGKQSLAVLPFQALGDAEEVFALGITDDLTTDLSKNTSLEVTGRDAAMAFKSSSQSVSQIAQRLGVQFVLTGNVRQVGDRVRINARLVDAVSGTQVWAERYDVTLTQIFAEQDSVTSQIIGALPLEAPKRITVKAGRYDTNDPEAQAEFDKGWAFFRDGKIESFAKAIPHLQKATEIDPDYARAHGALALLYQLSFGRNYIDAPLWYQFSLEEMGNRTSQRFDQANDVPNPMIHLSRALFRMMRSRHDDALSEVDQAAALAPDEPIVYEVMGFVLANAGETDRAVRALEKVLRMEGPDRGITNYVLGYAHFTAQHYDRAADYLTAAVKQNRRDLSARLILAATYGHLGRTDDAAAEIATINRMRKAWVAAMPPPGVEDKGHRVPAEYAAPVTLGFVNMFSYRRKSDRQNLRLGLIAAGVPASDPAERQPIADGVISVDTKQVEALRAQGAVLLDLRPWSAWVMGYIPGSVHIDYEKEWSQAKLLELVGLEDPIILLCGNVECANAKAAGPDAVAWGHAKVHIYWDGFYGWRSQGLPVAFDAGTPEENAQYAPFDGMPAE